MRDRLAPGGIFLQWLQAYEVDSETVRTVYSTFRERVPADRELVREEPGPDPGGDGRPDRLRRRRPARAAGARAVPVGAARGLGNRGLEGFLSHFVARSSFVTGLLAGRPTPRNTDDRNVIEFAFARSLGRKTLFDLENSRELARQRREDRPALTRGSVDWERVRRLRVSTMTAQGVAPRIGPDVKGEELRQSLAQKNFLEFHPDVVLAGWRGAPWEPVGSVELAVVSDALADGGDESAAVYIERLRETRPVEAAILLAQLRWRQRRFAEATDLFEKAFALYREDPWPLFSVMNRSFTTIADIAGRDRALAARLEKALAQPFALLILNEERLQTRYKVATYLDSSVLEEAILALEPHVPWRKALLERRARLYESAGNPRAPLARRELDLFLKNES